MSLPFYYRLEVPEALPRKNFYRVEEHYFIYQSHKTSSRRLKVSELGAFRATPRLASSLEPLYYFAGFFSTATLIFPALLGIKAVGCEAVGVWAKGQLGWADLGFEFAGLCLQRGRNWLRLH